MTTKNDIINLSKAYFDEKFGKPEFISGKNYIPPYGKVLDAEDCAQLIDASLDMCLTAGRFALRFEHELAKKFVKNTAQFNEIITLEDHLIDGGFGSWCMEALAQCGSRSCMIYPVALDPVVCGTVGSQRALNTLGGLYGEPLGYNTIE